MEKYNLTGMERYKEKFPDDEICVWKEIFKDRRAMAEGLARHCQLYCSGLLKTCEKYIPLSDFDEVKQI